MSIELENARMIFSRKDIAYPTMVGRLCLDFIPYNIRKGLVKTDDSNYIFTEEEAILYLGSLLTNIFPEDEMRDGINDIKYGVRTSIETAYSMLTIESVLECVKAKNSKLIAEAESVTDVEMTSVKLAEVLAKDSLPNVLSTITSLVSKELKKSKETLEKIESDNDKVISAANPEDNDGVPFDNGFEAGANGLPFSGDGDVTEEPSVSEENNDDGFTPIDEDIAGEEGEIYSESFRAAYADVLSGDLTYYIKRAVSIHAYDQLKDNPTALEDETFIAKIKLSTVGIIAFGFALIHLGLTNKKDYADRVRRVLLKDEDMERVGELNEIGSKHIRD